MCRLRHPRLPLLNPLASSHIGALGVIQRVVVVV
jgi:hypothetical protein